MKTKEKKNKKYQIEEFYRELNELKQTHKYYKKAHDKYHEKQLNCFDGVIAVDELKIFNQWSIALKIKTDVMINSALWIHIWAIKEKWKLDGLEPEIKYAAETGKLTDEIIQSYSYYY